MSKVAKKYIEKEISILEKFDRRNPELSASARNLNLAYLKGKTGQVYNREATIQSIQKILLRKAKANVLLTGAAGCGKTAIIEGLAGLIADAKTQWLSDCAKAERACKRDEMTGELVDYVEPPKPMFCDYVIYDLSMNSLLSGTQYRGQFEQKMDDLLKVCAENPNIILFIDEIHQINTIGADKDGASSMGQILKPALARGDIRVIGATTTEESDFVKKDKALARRFSEVIVPQLVGNSAVNCAEKIMADYSAFHGVSYSDVCAKELIEKVSFFLNGSVFPNNVIDVIDETLASARFDGRTSVTMQDMKKTLSRMSGVVIL